MIRLPTGRPLSLRARLIAGGAVLAALAVLAAQTVGVVVLRSWLLQQIDRQLTGFPSPARFPAAVPDHPPAASPDGITLPSDFRVVAYDSSGRFRETIGDGPEPGPLLPDTADRLNLADGRPATVAAVSGDGSWRVRTEVAPDGATYVVGLPLDTLDGATAKLLWLNAVVLLVTVLALLLLSRWVVGLGLRPLARMERTARDIGAGDAGLRLSDVDARTEIGRFGIVLNSMLDRLQEALRQRQASQDRLRRFVADAGHELRTPLTTIQGFAQLALRGDDRSAADRSEADHLIAQNAERMALLVDDLLLLATLDQEPVYARQPVDLLAIAVETISAVSPQYRGRRIGLSPLTGDLEPVEALGDPHRLQQVTANLLVNALIHTPAEAAVEIRVGRAVAGPAAGGTDRPGRHSTLAPLAEGLPICVLEVVDEGPGVPEPEAARVFERFYRVDRARSRERGGSGLGLAIASAIMQGHGGRVELETAAGHGCTFRLVLPAVLPRALRKR